jgi:hypothetical protein
MLAKSRLAQNRPRRFVAVTNRGADMKTVGVVAADHAARRQV